MRNTTEEEKEVESDMHPCMNYLLSQRGFEPATLLLTAQHTTDLTTAKIPIRRRIIGDWWGLRNDLCTAQKVISQCLDENDRRHGTREDNCRLRSRTKHPAADADDAVSVAAAGANPQ